MVIFTFSAHQKSVHILIICKNKSCKECLAAAVLYDLDEILNKQINTSRVSHDLFKSQINNRFRLLLKSLMQYGRFLQATCHVSRYKKNTRRIKPQNELSFSESKCGTNIYSWIYYEMAWSSAKPSTTNLTDLITCLN